jgi:hypothetical protein
MKLIKASVCACGATAVGTKHRKMMELHKKESMGFQLYNDETMLMRSAIGYTFFEGKAKIAAEMGGLHIDTVYRRGTSVDYIPLDYSTLAAADIASRWLYPMGEFKLVGDAPHLLADVVKTSSPVITKWAQWAICIDCDWKYEGRGSNNLGSWHACGSRHKVAYTGSKFNDNMITLIPVPVRRANTYRANFKQQMRMPCDIDPYKHPVFQYSRVPKEVVAAYKAYVRQHTNGRGMVDPPWVDPYHDKYKSLLMIGIS